MKSKLTLRNPVIDYEVVLILDRGHKDHAFVERELGHLLLMMGFYRTSTVELPSDQ